MKFIHLSDLHIGKRVNEFSMLDDQKYILEQIRQIIDNESPDAVFIAGDVYDKTIPSSDAVTLLDDFLYKLSKINTEVFIISGNHDSPERLSYAHRLIESSGIHFSPVYNGTIEPCTISDEFGDIDIYMLPFIKPVHVRRFFEDSEIESYTDAVAVAVENMNIDHAKRNVLLTHQFITGSSRTESEDVSVGGTDNVDVSVLKDFDYVALGHIHRPQNCGSERVRYCGTPLKYSFSEAKDKKSLTVGELGKNGELEIRTIDLIPLHDMVEIRGTYEEITDRKFYENTSYRDDYIHITLTDEDDVPEAVGRLRTIYHNLMKLDYDNTRTRTNLQVTGAVDVEKKSHLELFEEFFMQRNGMKLSEEQTAFMKEMIESIWEGEQ